MPPPAIEPCTCGPLRDALLHVVTTCCQCFSTRLLKLPMTISNPFLLLKYRCLNYPCHHSACEDCYITRTWQRNWLCWSCGLSNPFHLTACLICSYPMDMACISENTLEHESIVATSDGPRGRWSSMRFGRWRKLRRLAVMKWAEKRGGCNDGDESDVVVREVVEAGEVVVDDDDDAEVPDLVDGMETDMDGLELGDEATGVEVDDNSGAMDVDVDVDASGGGDEDTVMG